ncbi:hypothetical protein [Dysgonomonas sp. Marseille-Q5470]|uniref:acyltransferase n=1 Tax=Dysgonomonas sp. Marseille-Q5470 TaxID=3039494 RepID=UPI0024BC437F|nr:hypothetical protein [Dysgonomonas sp. Marseille-Q5470]
MRSKKKIKRFIKNYLPTISSYWNAIRAIKKQYIISEKKIGKLGNHSYISLPTLLAVSENIFIDDYVQIHTNSIVYNSLKEKLIIKKHTAISVNFVAILAKHIPTACIPHSILGPYHINDVHEDMIIDEEVWIGANVTLLPGASIGRGAVIGSCSLVNKKIPPYAVVVGIPAKIIASTFTIDQIIEHEKAIYPENERFSKEYLVQLFAEHFQEKKNIGISHISEEDRILLQTVKKELNIPNYE